MYSIIKNILLVALLGFLVSSISHEEDKDPKENILNEAMEAIGLCLHWGGQVGDQSENETKEY